MNTSDEEFNTEWIVAKYRCVSVVRIEKFESGVGNYSYRSKFKLICTYFSWGIPDEFECEGNFKVGEYHILHLENSL